ncbi:unnamed protein product [Ectocarpus fasciculatus]
MSQRAMAMSRSMVMLALCSVSRASAFIPGGPTARRFYSTHALTRTRVGRLLAVESETVAVPASVAVEANEPVSVKSPFLQTLVERGFYHQCTNVEGLDEKLRAGEVVKAYLGFDATADSLHVGSLLQIMILRHLQKAGHQPIVLVGGGTTKIGDPSGKDEARQLLDDAAIQRNIDGLASVFSKFLTFGDGPTDAKLVNNNEWLNQLSYLDFLREYGPHFTINRMMTYDSVRLRLEREQPLTFLEFNYMLLQAYDFTELYRRYGCVLQMGGSDQWGNMVNGVDLGRRVEKAELFALTAPLITTSEGKKMGKSAAGAVWLNAEKLPEYDYWQFWRNTDDADVIRFLKLFTELSMDEIHKLEQLTGAGINEAKIVLADETTKLLHGEACLKAIHQTVKQVFAGGVGGSNAALPRAKMETAEAEAGMAVVDLFIRLELAKTKSEVRRLIKGGGAKLNDQKITDEGFVVDLSTFDGNEELKLSSGKKRHGIIFME